MSVVLARTEIKSEGDALYEDILRDPKSDALRLIYADWCEDTGDLARAAFVRAQIRAYNTGGADCKHKKTVPGSWNDRKERCGECGFCEGMAEATSLLSAAYVPEARWPYTQTAEHWSIPPSWGPYAMPTATATFGLSFQRGFVSAVRCRTSSWLKWGPELVRLFPLERVVPSDRGPKGTQGFYAWYLSGRPAADAGDVFSASAHHLPPELHGVRPGLRPEQCDPFSLEHMRFYRYAGGALDAYSEECLRWANGQAECLGR